MRKVPAFLGIKLSDIDSRRLEMVAELEKTSKSGFARAAIVAAVRRRFAAEAGLPSPTPTPTSTQPTTADAA